MVPSCGAAVSASTIPQPPSTLTHPDLQALDNCCNAGVGVVAESNLIMPNVWGSIYVPDDSAATTTTAASDAVTITVTQTPPIVTTCISTASDAAQQNSSAIAASCDKNHDIAIGVGLGVPLAISLISVTAMAGYLCRQGRRGPLPHGGTYSQPLVHQGSPPTAYPISATSPAIWPSSSPSSGGSHISSPHPHSMQSMIPSSQMPRQVYIQE